MSSASNYEFEKIIASNRDILKLLNIDIQDVIEVQINLSLDSLPTLNIKKFIRINDSYVVEDGDLKKEVSTYEWCKKE